MVTVTIPHSCPQLLFASESVDAALLVREHSSFLLLLGRPFVVVSKSVHYCLSKPVLPKKHQVDSGAGRGRGRENAF